MSQISRPLEQLDIIPGAADWIDGSQLYQMNVVVTNPPGCVNVVVIGPPTCGWVAAYRSLRDKLAQEFAHDHGTITYSDDDVPVEELPQHAMSDAEVKSFNEGRPSPCLTPQHRPTSSQASLTLHLEQVAPVAEMTIKPSAPTADQIASEPKPMTLMNDLVTERRPYGAAEATKDGIAGNRRDSAKRKRIDVVGGSSHKQRKATSTNSIAPNDTIHVGGRSKRKHGIRNPGREVISLVTDEDEY